MNNDLRLLEKVLKQRCPSLSCHLNEHPNFKKSSWLDITHHDHFITVEWKLGEGFGLSSKEYLYVGDPEEIYLSVNKTANRILEILQIKETPPNLSFKDKMKGNLLGVLLLIASYFQKDHFDD